MTRRESGDETRTKTARCVLASCGRSFSYDPKDLARSSFPFCSYQCKGVDLGAWVTETYRVEEPALDEEEIDRVPRRRPASAEAAQPAEEEDAED